MSDEPDTEHPEAPTVVDDPNVMGEVPLGQWVLGDDGHWRPVDAFFRVRWKVRIDELEGILRGLGSGVLVQVFPARWPAPRRTGRSRGGSEVPRRTGS